MTAKELLIKAKAFFNGEVTPPAPPSPPAPPTPTTKTYKLQDGVTEIVINQAGEIPATGDTVMIGGVPAPANTYTLSDGATIVVDAAGAIATYTAMAAPQPPPPAPPAPPAQPQPVTLSAEEVKAMYEKFATGSTEERMANLEVMVKALMECNFGYEIRKGQEAAAIEAYKQNLAPLQVTIEAATAKLQSQFEKAEAQQQLINQHQETINKHQQTIKDLFELVEQLVDMPSADPATLTGRQKEKFEKMTAREERLAKMAEALKAKKTLA
jgi:hypothetical protein